MVHEMIRRQESKMNSDTILIKKRLRGVKDKTQSGTRLVYSLASCRAFRRICGSIRCSETTK